MISNKGCSLLGYDWELVDGNKPLIKNQGTLEIGTLRLAEATGAPELGAALGGFAPYPCGALASQGGRNALHAFLTRAALLKVS